MFGSTFQPASHVMVQENCNLHDWVDGSAGARIALPNSLHGGYATALEDPSLDDWVGFPTSNNYALPKSFWTGMSVGATLPTAGPSNNATSTAGPSVGSWQYHTGDSY